MTSCPSGLASGQTITVTYPTASISYKWGTVLEFSTLTPAADASGTGGTFGTAVSIPTTTVAAATAVACTLTQLTNTSVYTTANGYAKVSTQTIGTDQADYIYNIFAAAGSHNPQGSYAANVQWVGACVSIK